MLLLLLRLWRVLLLRWLLGQGWQLVPREGGRGGQIPQICTRRLHADPAVSGYERLSFGG